MMRRLGVAGTHGGVVRARDGRGLRKARPPGSPRGDDGFDPGRVADRHGVGPALMRERIEEFGGRFDLMSRPGAGTSVRARPPSPERAPAAVAGEIS